MRKNFGRLFPDSSYRPPGLGRPLVWLAISVLSIGAVVGCKGDLSTKPRSVLIYPARPMAVSRDLVLGDGSVAPGELIREVNISYPVDPDSVADANEVLVLPGEYDGPVVVEFTGSFALDNGTIPVSDVMRDGYVMWYSDQDMLLSRRIDLILGDTAANGDTHYLYLPLEIASDSFQVVSTRDPGKGLIVHWGQAVANTLGQYPGGSGSYSPTCAIMLSFLCLAAPPHDSSYISTTPPVGTIRIRAYKGSAVPSISVSCTPSPVERGQEVVFSAVRDGGGPLPTISEWKFTSAALSAPIIEPTSDTVWSGIVATSGEVTVTGTLDGDSVVGNGQIVVQARDWGNDTVRYEVVPKDQTGVLPVQPTKVGHLGATANVGDLIPLPEEHEQITSGPQSGVWYWLHTPVQAQSWIYINRAALQVNSDFYLLQPATYTAPDSCLQSDVLPFVPLVEAHEGLHLETDSHAEVFRRKLNELVPPVAEPVVSLGIPQDLDAKTATETSAAILQAQLYAKDSSNGGVVLPVPYCYFRYF